MSIIENPEDASFFESFEAAHTMHDLTSSIAKVKAIYEHDLSFQTPASILPIVKRENKLLPPDYSTYFLSQQHCCMVCIFHYKKGEVILC